MLRGIGIGAAGLVAGCIKDASDPGSDAAPSGPVVTMCGTNACIDLTNPRNANLASPGGSLIIDAAGDRIIVVRTSDTAFAATSDVCTHAGCDVFYVETSMILQCPCHGSLFSLTGSVIRGPALKPLMAYATMFDAATNTLTVVLV